MTRADPRGNGPVLLDMGDPNDVLGQQDLEASKSICSISGQRYIGCTTSLRTRKL